MNEQTNLPDYEEAAEVVLALRDIKNLRNPIFIEHLCKRYRISEVVELFPPTPSHEESIKGAVVVIRTGEEATI